MATGEVIDVPAFIIEEQSGLKRKLSLSGAALPFRGYAVPGSQRFTRTRYVGNPVATMQVLGSQEDDSIAGGIWRDRKLFIGTTHPAIAWLGQMPITTAEDLVNTMDSIRKMGQQVKVTWGRVVRVGLLAKFTPKWIYTTDCEWSCEFAWTSQGGVTPAPSINFQLSLGDISTLLNDISDSVLTMANKPAGVVSSFLEDAAGFVSFGNDISHSVNAGIFGSLGAVMDYVSLAETAADLGGQAIVTPLNAANACVGACTRAVDDFQNIAADIDARTALAMKILSESVATSTGGTSVPVIPGDETYYDTTYLNADGTSNTIRTVVGTVDADFTLLDALNGNFKTRQLAGGASSAASQSGDVPHPSGQLLACAAWMRNRAGDVRTLRRRAAAARAGYTAFMGVSVASVYVASAGDDLRVVATRFYGSSENWKQIMLFNNLDTPDLQSGQVVLVPNSQATQQAA